MDRPISDYAAIGDCHGSALVATDGSIDWACLSRFDADPLFCGLLNGDAGGRLETRPADSFETTRAYLPGTNILQTVFTTATGRIRLTDFLPVGRRAGAGVHDYVTLAAPGWIVRVVEGLDGEVPLLARYRPTRDMGRMPCRLTLENGRLADDKGGALFSDLPWQIEGAGAACAPTLRRGDVRHIVVASNAAGLGRPSPRSIKRLFNVTGAFWSEWLAYSRFEGPAAVVGMVERSALALKLLTYAPSGAIVAAATTSLPEIPGGDANWDYRYCWLRDGVFLLYALSVLGYSGEAHAFRRFLVRACRASNFDLQIMYGVEAETALDEQVIDDVRGWRGSLPVHRGNGAYQQTQLDVFGEVFEWVAQYHALGGRVDAEMRGMLEGLVERVVRIWREPDHGIWELRGPRHHYTLGRVMAWVALDRGLHLLGHDAALARECEAIRDTVWREAITADGVLKPAPDIEWMDASLLLVGIMGFPCPPGVYARTVERIEAELRDGDYVRRLPTDPGAEPEGAFLACSFWLVSAQLLVGRAADAEALFASLLTRANDVGLYAEEADPSTHAFLGNFPQALTHLALIEAAVNLDLYRRKGAEALQGRPAQRAHRAVGATAGVRGIWAAFRRAGHVGRLTSSRASVMPAAFDLL